jgi:hypothetical protein
MSAKQGKHIGFHKLESQLAHKPGIYDPAGLAAAIGREKYGNAGMAKKAAQGRAKAAIKNTPKG